MSVSRRSPLLVLAAGVVLSMLTSCLGVEVRTSFNDDGSGTMTMKLRISQMLLQMGQEGGAPVPLTKEDLEAAYKGFEGVSVMNVGQENTDQDRILTATVTFKDYSVFTNTKELSGAGAVVTREDGKTVYRVMIGESESTNPSAPAAGTAPAPLEAGGGAPLPSAEKSGAGESAAADVQQPDTAPADGDASGDVDATSQAMQAMLKSLVAGYSVSYTVTAPRPIVSHSVGEVSSDGKTAYYTIAMSDYMELKQPVMFEVKW